MLLRGQAAAATGDEESDAGRVVTDRNELDGQLYQQFCMAKDLLKQTPEQANSREELREMLASRESGGIIFTTVQKFSLLDDEDAHPRLCDRSNVVVISDEAHRSQYGLKARLKQIKDKETGEVTGAKYVFGYAKHMRDALPGASPYTTVSAISLCF